mgnify:CR=1 FL=1
MPGSQVAGEGVDVLGDFLLEHGEAGVVAGVIQLAVGAAELVARADEFAFGVVQFVGDHQCRVEQHERFGEFADGFFELAGAGVDLGREMDRDGLEAGERLAAGAALIDDLRERLVFEPCTEKCKPPFLCPLELKEP